jgi:hypothetical protein
MKNLRTFPQIQQLEDRCCPSNAGPIALNLGTPTIPAPPPTTPPVSGLKALYGSYVNWKLEDSLTNIHLDPGITGIALSVPWNDVQTDATTYDWTSVDNRLSEAATAGLKVELILNSSPTYTPAFVLNNPVVQTITLMDTNTNQATYGQNVTGPVFWDPIYLAARQSFIKAAGLRYGCSQTLVAVSASFANWTTDDWNVPHYVGAFTPPSGSTVNLNQVQQWLDAGYSTALMLGVGEQIIATTARAFPHLALKLAIGTSDAGLDGTATTLANEISQYGYAHYALRFLAQVDKLEGTTPVAGSSAVTSADPNSTAYLYQLLGQYSPQVGLQMVADATNTSSDNYRLNGGAPGTPESILQAAVDAGLSYHPAFLEYWTVDGENPAFDSIFEAATLAMQGG